MFSSIATPASLRSTGEARPPPRERQLSRQRDTPVAARFSHCIYTNIYCNILFIGTLSSEKDYEYDIRAAFIVSFHLLLPDEYFLLSLFDIYY